MLADTTAMARMPYPARRSRSDGCVRRGSAIAMTVNASAATAAIRRSAGSSSSATVGPKSHRAGVQRAKVATMSGRRWVAVTSTAPSAKSTYETMPIRLDASSAAASR